MQIEGHNAHYLPLGIANQFHWDARNTTGIGEWSKKCQKHVMPEEKSTTCSLTWRRI